MIRRRVEYIIICDCLRIFGYERCDGCANAFNSDSTADCATVAASEGWLKVSARLWLSPKCRKSYDEVKSALDAPERN